MNKQDKEELINNKELINGLENNFEVVLESFQMLKRLTKQKGNEENFNLAFKAFFNIFPFVPILSTKLDSSNILYRSRANSGKNKLFSNVSEISYNKDYASINEGRFNRNGESVFYASLPVSNLLEASLVSCLETVKELVQAPYVDFVEFTIGRWIVQEPFYVPNFCFDTDHLIANINLKQEFDEFISLIKSVYPKKLSEFILSFYEFFSSLSGKPTKDGIEYYILIAMFQAINSYYLHTTGEPINGLIYPSSMSERKGLNIVLQPSIVDRLLVCEKVIMYRFKRSGNGYDAKPCSGLSCPVDNKFQIIDYIKLDD